MAAAVVVAFLLGLFKVTDNEVWFHLKSGWQIEQEGVPAHDSFAYTTGDKRWVNLNWLYDWGLYQTELAESRSRVRRLVADYRKLLENRQLPKYDDEGRDVSKPLSDKQREELDQAFTLLASTADTSDTYQMRIAAERAAELVEDTPMQLPLGSQDSDKGSYPALARYAIPGGEALITLIVPIVVKGLLLAAMAGVLILVRHSGPTRWWTAVVVVLVLVAMGDRLTLTPEVFSLFFLSVLFWIFHAYQTGNTWAVWLLVPLEMLWVNVDSFFALGIVLAGIFLLVLMVVRPEGGDSQVPQGNRKSLAGAVALSIVATVANPFGLRAWGVPLEWTREMLGRMSYVAATAAQLCGIDAQWVTDARRIGGNLHTLAPDLFTPLSQTLVESIREFNIPPIATVLLIVLACMSFVLNRRRFQVARLLVLLLCLGMFLMAYRYMAIIAMAAGVMLCLNGQEWFLDRFGTETRITRGWIIWSVGGRAVTILAMVGIAILGITGRVGAAGGGEFGFGIQWVKFDLETGKFLRNAKLKGHALNTVPLQGNLLLWSNYPAGKVFLDGRVDVHKERLSEFETIKRALRGPLLDPDLGLGGSPATESETPTTAMQDDKAWEPLLDKHNISHVILNISAVADHVMFLRTYKRLRESDQWKLVHRDSSSAIFGRVGLPDGHALAEDSSWFEQNAFDPARFVYKENGPRLPEPPAAVTPPTFIDLFWQTRRIPARQTIVGTHFLNPSLDPVVTTGRFFMVPPENCILAIRQARNGISKQQRVSSLGYAVLFRAYFYLFNTEMSIVPNPEVNDLRHLQLLSALNQLVAANPDNLEARIQLALRYARLRFFDLADEHFEAVIKLMPEDATIENLMLDGGQMGKFSKSDIIGFSENLKVEIERVTYDLQQLSTQMPSPVVQANFLMQRGCPRMAIGMLTEASVLATSASDVSPMLAQLYVRIGQPGDPERGAERELLNMQGTGGLRPGAKKELWATVKLMQGDYERARTLMEDAIAETRHSLAKDSLLGLTDQLRSGAFLSMAFAPATAIEDADRQATLEFKLGMLQLEAGEPKEAERHFKQCLAVRERIPYRDVIGFYLEKLTGEQLEPLLELPMDEETQPPAAGIDPPAPPATVPPKPTEKPQDKE